MDDREDGELSSDTEVYNPISQLEDYTPVSEAAEEYNPVSRPVLSMGRSRPLSCFSEDESSSDSDSNSDLPKAKRICGGRSSQMSTTQQNNGVKKRNNIWSNILEEEALMQTIAGVDVKHVRKTDRNVESYAIPERIGDIAEMDSENESKKRQQRAERFHLSETRQPSGEDDKLMKERQLPDVDDSEEMTNEMIGTVIAKALRERKADLIIKIIEVLGKDLTLRLYKKTQQVEAEGGVLVMNGSRRRTSGGVFLYLLKRFDTVTKDHLATIFLEDKIVEVAKKRKRNMKKRKNFIRDGFSEKDIAEIEEANAKDYPEETGGIKCPGSTPVDSPQSSDPEEISKFATDPVHLVEACEKAAMEIEGRI